MRLLKENDNILMGILIGATVPVIGYFFIEIIFQFLTDKGLMDSATAGSMGKRQRTLALMGICCNIIPIQFLNSRYNNKTLKGVLVATFIYAGLWLFNFGRELL